MYIRCLTCIGASRLMINRPNLLVLSSSLVFVDGDWEACVKSCYGGENTTL